jgi:two-component system sensor histidine kinase/response regulator
MPNAPAPRMLIVDDEVAHMQALCDTLRDHGYETVGYTTGQEALAALREGEYDLLLTDLMMPEMDGITLLRMALTVDPQLVGIIMTGQGTLETAVDAMKAGALDYILKPFTLRIMLPVLTRALAVRQLRLDKTALERHLRERTAALEAANRELDAFAFSVSHDLRAPLRAVSGFTSILARDYAPQLPAEAQRLLQHVTTNAQRMEQLIEALLRCARLGRQQLVTQPVPMAALVQEVLHELRHDLGDRHVVVQVAELPVISGDPALLKQVFVNLLSNAFKFTRQQERAVVEVGCQTHAEEQVYFVRDNGVGFDMQYADKLFGVFQRLHSPAQFEGTGVGLAIVHSIIRRHGGRVWAEAAVDQGATFYVGLPA